MALRRRDREQHVHSVTTVRYSPAEDLHRREVQYLVTMAFRIVCFAGAMVTTGPVRWIALLFAVFLPWVAVVIANNRGAPRHSRVDPGARSLGSSPAHPQQSADGPAAPSEPLSGTIHLPPAPTPSPSVDVVHDARHAASGLPSGGISEKNG